MKGYGFGSDYKDSDDNYNEIEVRYREKWRHEWSGGQGEKW